MESNQVTRDPSVMSAQGVKISAREECIEQCYEVDAFSDIKFVVGDKQIGPQKTYHLHRLVLAGQSPLLYKVCLSGTPVPREGIPITEVQPEVFDHVVRWLYKGVLVDRIEDATVLAKIHEAAEQLEIKELENKVLQAYTTLLDDEDKKENREQLRTGVFGENRGKQDGGGKVKRMFKGAMEKLSIRRKDAGYGSAGPSSARSSIFSLRKSQTSIHRNRLQGVKISGPIGPPRHIMTMGSGGLGSGPLAHSTPISSAVDLRMSAGLNLARSMSASQAQIPTARAPSLAPRVVIPGADTSSYADSDHLSVPNEGTTDSPPNLLPLPLDETVHRIQKRANDGDKKKKPGNPDTSTNNGGTGNRNIRRPFNTNTNRPAQNQRQQQPGSQGARQPQLQGSRQNVANQPVELEEEEEDLEFRIPRKKPKQEKDTAPADPNGNPLNNAMGSNSGTFPPNQSQRSQNLANPGALHSSQPQSRAGQVVPKYLREQDLPKLNLATPRVTASDLANLAIKAPYLRDTSAGQYPDFESVPKLKSLGISVSKPISQSGAGNNLQPKPNTGSRPGLNANPRPAPNNNSQRQNNDDDAFGGILSSFISSKAEPKASVGSIGALSNLIRTGLVPTDNHEGPGTQSNIISSGPGLGELGNIRPPTQVSSLTASRQPTTFQLSSGDAGIINTARQSCRRLQNTPLRPARAQRYTEFLEMWGYPAFSKPLVPEHIVANTLQDRNADWYEVARRRFQTEELRTITERYEDGTTAEITEMRPVWADGSERWGCDWDEWEVSPGRFEDMCRLKYVSRFVAETYPHPRGRWMFADGIYYEGMDALAYKAIDAILYSREARHSFHWVYRACGVKKPRYKGSVDSYDYVDVYIDIRIDVAGVGKEETWRGHAAVPVPHMQFTVFTPVNAAWYHDQKPTRGPFKWMGTEVGGATPVPGECLMQMLRSKHLPCAQHFYDSPDGIRRHSAWWVEPWYSLGHRDTDFLPPFNELEVVLGWEREDGSPEDERNGWVRGGGGNYRVIPKQRLPYNAPVI
ncbi:hypothetical protein TWF694_005757 [Orbilia ellipsospora]|uniref:BTB domain-containing protein n=1 Tax=Orbilia ellipsospora TaxID=2528407 RepID=A0AAV9WRU5_9PEZI